MTPSPDAGRVPERGARIVARGTRDHLDKRAKRAQG
jgi:hypothetical protein